MQNKSKNKIILSIIVINYQTPQLTIQTIKSIYQNLLPNSFLNNHIETILIDNCSPDDSWEQFQQLKFPNLKLVKNTQNLGFSYGNNVGLKIASGNLILLLNSDTIVLKGSLEKILKFFIQNQSKLKLGSLAFDLLNKNLTHQLQGGDLPNLFTLWTHWSLLSAWPIIGKFFPSTQKTSENQSKKNILKNDQIYFQKMGWVGGTALLFERQIIDRIGFWDENIFMYGEDIDWCYRLKKIKLKVGILKNAFIIHWGSQSAGKSNAILGEIKSYLYFYRKQKKVWLTKICYLIIKWGVWLRIGLFFFLNKEKCLIYQKVNRAKWL